MTDAERRAALVEKVARELCRSAYVDVGGYDWEASFHPDADRDYWLDQAAAAITVALEEAARVCDPKGDCSEMDKYGEHYAAAIRELIK
jgi:hypothetical protein